MRKTVTILFADVTGSTALGERLDPEAVRRVMGRWFESARNVLERHGGTVEKFVGDAVMAVFGIPTLHEDDALRAVRAAAELDQALAELNSALERDYGVRLEVRTGVSTGEVVAGEGETLATGDAVNVAARLEQAAQPGEILLGPDTFLLVRDAVDADPVRPLRLKGKAEPVEARRLRSVRPGVAGFERRLDAPLVGRRLELAQLRQAYERAVRERRASLFTLLGPAGIGKSRLVEEFCHSIAGEATVLRGRCLPYGEGITYWPLVEMLQDAGRHGPAARVRELLAGEPDAELVAARLDVALGEGDAGGSTDDAFWAARKLFEHAARSSSLVLVVDDLHWAEETFLDLVDHVADWSREAPILLLCVARPELLEARPTWGGGKLNATTLFLDALSEGESRLLIAELLVKGRLADDVSERIVAAAEGNPLFVEQMLAMLLEDGADPAPAVPPTIQALLAARLDRLDPSEQQVIERASIEGRHFHRGAVEELAPDSLRGDVSRLLLALVRKELVRPAPSAHDGDEGFEFRHQLIRDAAYEAVPKQSRAELHERFADRLEARGGGLEEIVGYHLEQAYRYRVELGPADEAVRLLAERAAQPLLAAGFAAHARADSPAALGLLARAAALLPAGDARRLEALLSMGSAALDSGSVGDAERYLGEVLEHGDAVLRARARVNRLELVSQTDPEATMERELERAYELLDELERLGDEIGVIEARLAIGRGAFVVGRLGLSEEAFEEAARLASAANDRRLLNEANNWLVGTKLLGPAPIEEGAALCRRLLEDPLCGGRVECFALTSLGQFEAALGRIEEGRALVARGLAVAEEFGLVIRRGVHSLQAAEVELMADDPEAAARHLREGDEILRGMGETGFRSSVLTYLAHALARLGRSDEARAVLGEAEQIVQEDDFDAQARIRLVRASLALREGDHGSAEALAREALEILRDRDYVESTADAELGLAEALRAAGRRDEAVRLAEEAAGIFERHGNIVRAGEARALAERLAAPA